MNKTEQKALARGEELMTRYAELSIAWKKKADSIKEDLNKLSVEMDETEKELLAIGEAARPFFVNDNLIFEDGYLHISSNSFVKLGKKFDLSTFQNAYPEMVDVQKALKLSPIKKAFLDAGERKLIKAMGVEIDSKESMKVIAKKE
jgi:hypothetical protein